MAKKKEFVSRQEQQMQLEHMVLNLNGRIESLKTQYNLYFAGELRIPPESERESLEKIVRDLQFKGNKTPRATLLIQNLSSSFSVYNNMWKKRLTQVENGTFMIQKKKTTFYEDLGDKKEKKKTKKKEEFLDVSLNSEDSFDKFFDKYAKVMKKGSNNEEQREKIINSLKTKLISQNLIDAKVSLGVSGGKLKLRIKSSQNADNT